jgi:phospholipase/carboxylesterase
MLSRRTLLTALAAALLTSCRAPANDGSEHLTMELGDLEPEDPESLATSGLLAARPGAPSSNRSNAVGLQSLRLGGQRDGLLYVPAGYRPDRLAPFALILHGAGADARAGLEPLLTMADRTDTILLAPDSRETTWDVVLDWYGPDVMFIDDALARVFERYAIDPRRLAIAGFSDGGSYALSLGLTNGDLFSHVIAFSPGFAAPTEQRGHPRVFVSHGTQDTVIPIDGASRQIVAQAREAGYDVTYREFAGAHVLPEEITREAVAWFLAPSA